MCARSTSNQPRGKEAYARYGSRLLAVAVSALVVTAAGCGGHGSGAGAGTGTAATGGNTGQTTTTTAHGTSSTTATSTPGHGSSVALTLSGNVSDSISAASVVCLKESVAASAGKFFFDIVGTTAGGKPLVFSGTFNGYTGPATYQAPPSGVVLEIAGTPYAGVQGFRPQSGSITIGSGGTSGSFASLKVPAANPNVSGAVTVSGPFTCGSYTTATGG